MSEDPARRSAQLKQDIIIHPSATAQRFTSNNRSNVQSIAKRSGESSRAAASSSNNTRSTRSRASPPPGATTKSAPEHPNSSLQVRATQSLSAPVEASNFQRSAKKINKIPAQIRAATSQPTSAPEAPLIVQQSTETIKEISPQVVQASSASQSAITSHASQRVPSRQLSAPLLSQGVSNNEQSVVLNVSTNSQYTSF